MARRRRRQTFRPVLPARPGRPLRACGASCAAPSRAPGSRACSLAGVRRGHQLPRRQVWRPVRVVPHPRRCVARLPGCTCPPSALLTDALPAPGVCAGPAARTGSVLVGDILFEVDGQNGAFRRSATAAPRAARPGWRRRGWSVRAEGRPLRWRSSDSGLLALSSASIHAEPRVKTPAR